MADSNKYIESQSSTEHQDFRVAILDLQHALNGDLATGDIGMVKKLNEMYDAWSAIIWFGKAIGVLAVFFAAIATGWATFGSAIKHIFTNIFNSK